MLSLVESDFVSPSCFLDRNEDKDWKQYDWLTRYNWLATNWWWHCSTKTTWARHWLFEQFCFSASLATKKSSSGRAACVHLVRDLDSIWARRSDDAVGRVENTFEKMKKNMFSMWVTFGHKRGYNDKIRELWGGFFSGKMMMMMPISPTGEHKREDGFSLFPLSDLVVECRWRTEQKKKTRLNLSTVYKSSIDKAAAGQDESNCVLCKQQRAPPPPPPQTRQRPKRLDAVPAT